MTAWWLGLSAFWSIVAGLVAGLMLAAVTGIGPEVDDTGKRAVDLMVCLLLVAGFTAGGIGCGAELLRAVLGTVCAMACGAVAHHTREVASEEGRLGGIAVAWVLLMISVGLWVQAA